MCGLVFSARAEPQKTPDPEKTDYSWRQTDSSLALLNHGRVVWQFNFDNPQDAYRRKQGKPYFHPVCLTDGTELTWDSPPDHPWHHGLWFSWKHINTLNYWEEDRKTGLSQGRADIADVQVRKNKDYSAWFTMDLKYHPPEKQVVLSEKRSIKVSAPDKQGRYIIDWSGTFKAGETDVVLDRTPIPGEKDGKSWGGYAGLSVRIAEHLRNWEVVDSEGRKGLESHGKKARWVDFSGETADGKIGGVTVFDESDNKRYPSPWSVIMNPKVPFGYFSPAFLFDKPYELEAGKELCLRYGILIHPGRANRNYLELEWKNFQALKRIGKTKKRIESIDKQLGTSIDVSHWTRETPFGEAIKDLKNSIDPPLGLIVLWRDLYDNAGIDQTTPIYMDGISDVPLGTVLKLLLMAVSGSPRQLGYVVNSGVITVGTKASLQAQWKTHVYDIRDLL